MLGRRPGVVGELEALVGKIFCASPNFRIRDAEECTLGVEVSKVDTGVGNPGSWVYASLFTGKAWCCWSTRWPMPAAQLDRARSSSSRVLVCA